MILKLTKTAFYLLIISILFNGCASTKKASVLKDGIENHSTFDEQKSSAVVDKQPDGKSSVVDKELAMQMITFFALPLFIPIIFIAALFSGVG